MHFVERHYWSIMTGCDVTRLSVSDAHGGEHFCIVPKVGKGWRDVRAELLETLARHAESADPGEVEIAAPSGYRARSCAITRQRAA